MNLKEEFAQSGLLTERFVKGAQVSETDTTVGTEGKPVAEIPKIDDNQDQIIPAPPKEADSEGAEGYTLENENGLKSMLEAACWAAKKVEESWDKSESQDDEKKQMLNEMCAKMNEYKSMVEGWCK